MKPHITIPKALGLQSPGRTRPALRVSLRGVRRAGTIPVVLLLALGIGGSHPAGAWMPAMHVEIARQAATIAPPDLFRQIKRHENAFSAGLATSIAGSNHSDEGEALLSRIRSGSNAIAESIEAHRPFRDIVRELGRLAVYAAEANNPLEHSADDPTEGRYRTDYEHYVASAFPRFEVVFYGEGRDVRTNDDLTRLLSETERRGTNLYPLLGLEYRRIGTVDGVRLFDDKSTAFGVGSIAFSHAVSDLAAIYRYIWLRSGGGDSRELPITAPIASNTKAALAVEPSGARVR